MTRPPLASSPQGSTEAGAWVRRVFLWLYVLAASLVAIGVLVQTFSIVAYVRGADQDALDLHTTGGFITHSIEIVVFLLAVVLAQAGVRSLRRAAEST